MPVEPLKLSVFVSYARVDDDATHGRISAFVTDLKAAYRSHTGTEVDVFFDLTEESLPTGSVWRDRIRAGLAASPVFIAFVTPAYLASVNCRAEFSDFYEFFRADGSARLLLPLVYVAPNKITDRFGGHDVWRRIDELNWSDVHALRTAAVGSAEWMRRVERVADSIEEVLSRSAPVAAPVEPRPDERPGSGALIDGLAEELRRFSGLMTEVAEAVRAETVALNRAATPADRRAVTARLSGALSPLAEAYRSSARRISDGVHELDAVLTPDLAGSDAVGRLAGAGLDAITGLDRFHDGIRAVMGMSRELDAPLAVLRNTVLAVADLRGVFQKWRAG